MPRLAVPSGALARARYGLAKSPSKLASTDRFDDVKPVPAISCTAARMRATSPG